MRISSDGGHVPDYHVSQSNSVGSTSTTSSASSGNPTGVKTSIGSSIIAGFSPVGFVERTTETLFHPAPPSTGAGNMPTIDVGGAAQSVAAAAKTPFTQAWTHFTSVFSEPLRGNPGNNPEGVNVTKTPNAPSIASTAKTKARGRGEGFFGGIVERLFPNG